jgi:hypothetical protein
MNSKDDFLGAWSVADVKSELPMVRVRVGKRNIIDAKVSGRLNEFASVSWANPSPVKGSDLFPTFHFAWETIAHSLNTGRPLEL